MALCGKTLACMGKRVTTRFKLPPQPTHFIRHWRKFRGLTQERLAERLGVAPSSISQLERGKQGYSQGMLEALATALGTEAGSLLMRNPNDPEAPWTIWDQLKPATKRQAIELLKTLQRTDQSEAA
jgi:transcriptional regulator with XRE-family HTH domain